MKRTRLNCMILALALMMALVIPTAASAEDSSFSDVSETSWYYEAVDYVRRNGLMDGTGSHFSPDESMTRAMLATVLYRAAGSPEVSGEDSFPDTDAGKWYSDGVLWAYQQKLVEGYDNGLFGTNDHITREQLTTILWREAGRPDADPAEAFADSMQISGYAKAAVNWARSAGIIHGKPEGRFDPKGEATRAEVATILMNQGASAIPEKTPEPTPAPTPELTPEPTHTQETEDTHMIQMKINDEVVTVDWQDNASVTALREKLKSGPLTISMNPYGGFEQVGSLGFSLPRNDVQTTTAPGDIVLYSGNQIVLFYGSNSWSYTRLGKLSGLSNEEITTMLSGDGVTVTLELIQ